MRRIFERYYEDQYMGRKIIDTKHSIDRFVDKDRFSDYGSSELKQEILRVIKDGIAEILSKHNDSEGVYVIHSQSTKIGVVIMWRREGNPKLDDGQNHAIVVTVLPRKPNHSKKNPSDTMLYVEVVEQIMEFLKRKKLTENVFSEKKFEEGSFERVYVNELGFELYLFENELYDISAKEILVK